MQTMFISKKMRKLKVTIANLWRVSWQAQLCKIFFTVTAAYDVFLATEHCTQNLYNHIELCDFVEALQFVRAMIIPYPLYIQCDKICKRTSCTHYCAFWAI